jgi:hypothetical protein
MGGKQRGIGNRQWGVVEKKQNAVPFKMLLGLNYNFGKIWAGVVV